MLSFIQLFFTTFIVAIFFIGDIESDCGVYYKRRGKREVTITANAGNRNETDYDTETNDATNYIIGGRFANPGEFPWQVHLKIFYDRNAYYYTTCGGVIWNSNFILTAAHCLVQCENNYFKKPLRVEVCVGDYNIQRRDGERCMNGWRWWTNKGFNPCGTKFFNDIAIIQLREALKIPSITNNGYGSVNIACHPTMDTNPRVATLSGWGRYSIWNSQNANVLKMVNLPIWSLESCRKKWDVSESQICAGGNYAQNSCMGDSGGPLVTYIDDVVYVVGLSSYGPNPCAQRGIPNVFTKIAYFTSWINETINSRVMKY